MSLYVCTNDHRHSRWLADTAVDGQMCEANLRRPECGGRLVRAADSVSAMAALACYPRYGFESDPTRLTYPPDQNRVLDVLQAHGYPADGPWRAGWGEW